MQHLLAASMNNKQTVYSGHNSMGKADLFATVTPKDYNQVDILVYALPPGKSILYKDALPIGNRFDILTERSVVAGLLFKRVDKMIIKIIFGWDIESSRPFICGGLFGILNGFIRVVQKQGRSTLHGHYLIWLAGHGDLKLQTANAAEKAPQVTPNSTDDVDSTLQAKPNQFRTTKSCCSNGIAPFKRKFN